MLLCAKMRGASASKDKAYVGSVQRDVKKTGATFLSLFLRDRSLLALNGSLLATGGFPVPRVREFLSGGAESRASARAASADAGQISRITL
jgi:hypothetical protein